MIGVGRFIGIGVNRFRAGGVSAEYQAVYDSFTTKPSAAVAAAQNIMVKSLVDAGVWAKRDIIYLLAQEVNTDGEALTNFKIPGTYDGTLVNAPTFTSLEGFTGNGISSYINSNYNPSSNGVKYTVNSASISIYQRTDSDNLKALFGTYDSTNGVYYMPTITNTAYARINDAASLTWSQTTSNLGYIHINRDGASSRAVFKDNVSKDSDTESASIIPNLEMIVLGRNEPGTPDRFDIAQVSYFAIGGSLTSDERLAEMNAIETYMDSNSKGILS